MKNIHNKADYDEVVGRIATLNKLSQRRWGIMMVEQMLSHCSDQIRLATGEKEPHEKPTFINRNIAKYLGLWLPQIPFKNMKDPVDMNQKYYGTPSTDIETEKEFLTSLLYAVRNFPKQKKLNTHPMFGELNFSQWGRFMYVHIDHHLRQFGK